MLRQQLSDAAWAVLKQRRPSIGRIWKHAQDDRNRRFVEAVYSLLRTGLPWADLPAAFGNSDAVRKRFRRWCKAGVWQWLFEGTVPAERIETLMLDGSIAKAHRSAAGARAGTEEDIGRSRGGLTTKIGAAVCATTQKIIPVVLAPGQRNDCVLAKTLLGPIEGAAVIADKAPASPLLPRIVSMKGAPRNIQRKHGVNVTHVASKPPSVPAIIGERPPGSRYAAMKPTNCSTMISGPGVVSAMPSPSSISRGCTH